MRLRRRFFAVAPRGTAEWSAVGPLPSVPLVGGGGVRRADAREGSEMRARWGCGWLLVACLFLVAIVLEAAGATAPVHAPRVRLVSGSGLVEQPADRAARVARLAVLALQDHAPVLALDRALYPALPTTRAECENGIRPCPFVSCRYHLGLGISRTTGQVRLHYGPSLADGEIPANVETCALDVAEDGRQSQQVVAGLLVCT